MEKVSQLQSLHSEVARRLAVLERVAKAPDFKLSALTEARLQLTRASRRRTDFIESVVLPHLLASKIQRALAGVEELQKDIASRRAASSDHIARWRPSDIEEDWSGYQAASAAMRDAMRGQIRREQAVLYPLLRLAAAHDGTGQST